MWKVVSLCLCSDFLCTAGRLFVSTLAIHLYLQHLDELRCWCCDSVRQCLGARRCSNLRVRIVAGRLRSYLDPKFDLCQHLPCLASGLCDDRRTSWCGWRMVWIWMLPLLEQILGLAEQSLVGTLVRVQHFPAALPSLSVVLDP